MVGDNNGLTDEFDVSLGDSGDDQPGMTLQINAEGKVERAENGTLPSLPSAPKSDRKSDWVKYCVALGADEHYLTKETEHGLTGTDEVEVHPPMTLDELKELAYNLGG